MDSKEESIERNFEDDNDDVPCLPADTMKILEEFYQNKLSKVTEDCGETSEPIFEEDWQLSQFWYDEKTADVLAKEALKNVSCNGRIACISCPTVYSRLRQINQNNIKLKILEFDTRFKSFGPDFIFYDFNEPLKLDSELEDKFDMVLADPPFLSEECMEKVAKTINFLTKKKIILCTGIVMKECAKKLLNLELCDFKPSHARNLGNEFSCFSNYKWT